MYQEACEDARVEIVGHRCSDSSKRGIGVFHCKPHEETADEFTARRARYFFDFRGVDFLSSGRREYFLEYRERIAERALGEKGYQFCARTLHGVSFALRHILHDLREYLAPGL